MPLTSQTYISPRLTIFPGLPPLTLKCVAILEALKRILSLTPNTFLIASDSLSSLHGLSSNNFPLLFLLISRILYNLGYSEFAIRFLWISSHSSIQGNQMADSLAKSSSSLRSPSPFLIPRSDLCLLFRTHINKM